MHLEKRKGEQEKCGSGEENAIYKTNERDDESHTFRIAKHYEVKMVSILYPIYFSYRLRVLLIFF